MVTLLFSGINPANRYGEYKVNCPDIESCFEYLTIIVPYGWKLKQVKISNQQGELLVLPVEAFDGQPIRKHIEQLQQDWEKLLNTNLSQQATDHQISHRLTRHLSQFFNLLLLFGRHP